MTKLHNRPVRRRARAARPNYPRKLSLGAIALMTAMAGTAMGCANLVETAEGDEATDDDLSFQDLDRPAWIHTNPDDDYVDDGEYAGGIGEEWEEEGGSDPGTGGAGGGFGS